MEISIVIPTYERPTQIRRTLAYWHQYPVQVIVMDGSPEPTVSEAALVDCPNVAYHHMSASLEERLLTGASLVRTPYAMLLPDDEFLVYPALVEATQILNSHSDVAAVLGSTFMFSLFNGRFVGAPCYSTAHQLNIDSASPIGRLNQRVRCPGNSIYYSLTRAHVLQVACQFIAEKKYSCPYVSEYQMEAVLCAVGKVRVMKRLLWLRSAETSPISMKGWRRSILFHEWCDDSKNAEDLAFLKKSADKFLSMAGNSEENITGPYFAETFAKFESEANMRNQSLAGSFRNCGRLLFNLLPIALTQSIKTLLGTLGLKRKGSFMEFDQLLVELKHIEVRADEADLTRIKRLVEKTGNL